MRILVLLLVALGTFVAIERGVDSVAVLGKGVPPGELSAADRRKVELAADRLEIRAGGDDAARLEREMASAAAKFYRYPVSTLLHVAAGALFLVLALAQFSATLRSRHPAVHRWSGRMLLALGAAFTLTGFFFAIAVPYGGFLELSATLVFGSFFLFAGARAWVFIRRGDVRRHREWMIRMFATALGIATIRLIGLVTLAFLSPGVELVSPQAFGEGLWMGWMLTLLAAELWIRSGRRSSKTNGPPKRAVVPDVETAYGQLPEKV